ncbi:MAG: nuclear transport factor 2 family protein [Sphingomonadaceae bacterium]|jgi:hypothetical protein
MDEARIEALEKQVAYLTDRQAIYDLLTSTSRGNDRFDVELIVGGYHEDGLHELGAKIIKGSDYGEHANTAHHAISAANLHNVTMHRCEIDGDTAHCESYVIGLFLDPDTKKGRILAGRYIDRLEKREGRWGIVLRRATVEVAMEGEAILPNGKGVLGSGYLRGDRGKSDPSYQRPLTGEGGERW